MSKANKLALKLIDDLKGQSVDRLLREYASGERDISRAEIERALAISEAALQGK